MNDIWEKAIEMEEEGKAFYAECARTSVLPDLKGVFTFLADQEEHHAHLFRRMSKELPALANENGNVLGNARLAFDEIAKRSILPDLITDSASLYAQALEMEKGAVKYYKDALHKTAVAEQKLALEFIIKQEQAHVKLFDSMIAFVKQPKQWLEDAEWNHWSEEY
jgi:rubrerythrin